jgi:hypothetical protein
LRVECGSARLHPPEAQYTHRRYRFVLFFDPVCPTIGCILSPLFNSQHSSAGVSVDTGTYEAFTKKLKKTLKMIHIHTYILYRYF